MEFLMERFEARRVLGEVARIDLFEFATYFFNEVNL